MNFKESYTEIIQEFITVVFVHPSDKMKYYLRSFLKRGPDMAWVRNSLPRRHFPSGVPQAQINKLGPAKAGKGLNARSPEAND